MFGPTRRILGVIAILSSPGAQSEPVEIPQANECRGPSIGD